ncbi:MAG: M48 family metallopeptidase [Candidatus Woesebacteria bacterium]|jgi:predicted metal-dependent hydrolase
MSTFVDPEFGSIYIRRSSSSSSVKLRLDQNGKISISLPKYAPAFFAKKLLNESRQNLRKMLSDIATKRHTYKHGDLIGKSHTLVFEEGETYKHRIYQTNAIVTKPPQANRDLVNKQVYLVAKKALKIQANAYLPRRIAQFAESYGFTYQKLRFSSAGTRWGSCSSQQTISLNIWLMTLPLELIDYVIIHELCHTKYMNHSQEFWQLVGTYCSDYKLKRKALKLHQPSI